MRQAASAVFLRQARKHAVLTSSKRLAIGCSAEGRSALVNPSLLVAAEHVARRAFSSGDEPLWDSTRPISSVQVEWAPRQALATQEQHGKDTDRGLEFVGRGPNQLGTDKAGVKISGSGADDSAAPMQLLLMGLASCAMVDVVTIMRKARQNLGDLRVDVQAQRLREGPRPFESIHMNFVATPTVGGSVDERRLLQAVDLSTDKYCGAHATLAKACKITHSVEVVLP